MTLCKISILILFILNIYTQMQIRETDTTLDMFATVAETDKLQNKAIELAFRRVEDIVNILEEMVILINAPNK